MSPSKGKASTTDGSKGGRERTKGTFGKAQPTKAKKNGCPNIENRIKQHGTVTEYQTKAPYTEKAFQVFFRENHSPKGEYNDFALTKSTGKSLFCIASENMKPKTLAIQRRLVHLKKTEKEGKKKCIAKSQLKKLFPL